MTFPDNRPNPLSFDMRIWNTGRQTPARSPHRHPHRVCEGRGHGENRRGNEKRPSRISPTWC